MRFVSITRAKSAEWIKADYNSGADTLLIYGAEELCPLALTILYNTGINKLYINGTERANNTVIYIDKDVNVNATATLNKNYLFFKYMLDDSPDFVNPYMFNMTQSYTLWTYAVSEVNPKTAYDITMSYSPSGTLKTGTVYSFTAHAFIYNEGLESWNNYECKYKWYADNSIVSYGDSNSNGIFVQDFNFGSEQTHIFRVVIFDSEDAGYLSPLYDETFDYISYTSGAEIMIVVAMAISLSLAILSVFIPLASIGAFIINFGYLVFNVNSVIELRELVIIVLFISTVIGFFGIYQTKGE